MSILFYLNLKYLRFQCNTEETMSQITNLFLEQCSGITYNKNILMLKFLVLRITLFD